MACGQYAAESRMQLAQADVLSGTRMVVVVVLQ